MPAIIKSISDLHKHLPSHIDHPEFGRAILEVTESNGWITGGYALPDSCILLYTFSSSPQEFYNEIVPYLVIHGLIR